MKNYKFEFLGLKIPYCILLIIILSIGCKDNVITPPLPNDISQFEQPLKKTYKFTQSESVTWDTLNFPGLSSITKKDFDLKKIQGKPFDLNIDDTLLKPIEWKDLDWGALETMPLDYENWPTEKLHFKVRKLGAPTITRAASPVISQNSTSGIFVVDDNFGIEGVMKGIFKDSNEMIWFANNNSVVKYDSNQLFNYGNEQGLNLGNAFAILEDSKGRIWVGDSNSISVLDLDLDLIYELQNNFPSGPAYHIFEDKQGKIWATNSNAGYLVIDIERKNIKHFAKDQGLINQFTVQASQDTDGLIWLSTGGGFNILDFENNKNIKLTSKAGLAGVGPGGMLVDKSGDYWVGTEKGINIINNEKNKIASITADNLGPSFRNVLSPNQDNNGVYWMGTESGLLFSLNMTTSTFKEYKVNPGDGNVIYKSVFDHDGRLWVAMVTGGVYVLDVIGNKSTNFSTQNGIGNKEVWGTLQSTDGKSWIGTHGGVDVYVPQSGEIKHLTTKHGLINDRNSNLFQDSQDRIWLYGNTDGITIIDEKDNSLRQISESMFFNDIFISYITEINTNEFLLGSNIGVIFYLDLNKNLLKRLSINPENNRNADYNITEIVKDNNNDIWLSTRARGIYKLDNSFNTIKKTNEENGLISDQVFSLLKSEEFIWAATLRGLQRLNSTNNESLTFTTSQGLPINDVYDLTSNEGRIFGGTSVGLAILEQENDLWNIEIIGKGQGLSHLDFAQNSMSVDKKGRVWAGIESQVLSVIDVTKADSTNLKTYVTGINIYDNKILFRPKTEKLEPIYKFDTIYNSQNNDFTFQKDKEFIQFDDKDIIYSDVQGPFNMPQNIELAPNKNYLSFTYTGFQFKNQDQLLYTYFLEGIDKNWSHVTKQTTSENYRDLPPGDYTFKVAAKNGSGSWSEPTELNFTILPPWWQTWWAYLIFGILTVSTLWAIMHYRSKWLKKENRLLEEKVAIRTSQLQNKIEELKSTQTQLIHSEKMASLGELTAGIAHEIQNPLNFVNNFSDINCELITEMHEELQKGNYEEAKALANDIKSNEEKIMHHGKRADSIVKGMLQHSRNNVGVKEDTDINMLCDEYLRLAYHGLRAKDRSFNATLKTELDSEVGKIEIIPQDIGRVILNLITNAFYAVSDKKQQLDQAGANDYVPTVTVETKRHEHDIEINVKDDGNGIPQNVVDKIFQPFFTTKPSGKGTGLGLSLSYDIIKVHGGELKVKTEEGIGTTFCILLPLKVL